MAAPKDPTSPTLFEPSIESSDVERRSVYTDGACIGNPGPGGWGWAASVEEFASGAEPRTTNQRMELMAVIQALGAIDGAVEVVSDSTYVVNCFRDRWWQGWKRRGWRNSKGEPVANRDLWEPLITEVIDRREPGDVVFRWVKGHAGEPMNEFVDGLATEAARSQQGRRAVRGSGESRP